MSHANHAAIGRCWDCKNPPAPGRRRCATCAEKNIARGARRLEKRWFDGLCAKCDNQHAHGHKLCKSCLKRLRENDAHRSRLRPPPGWRWVVSNGLHHLHDAENQCVGYVRHKSDGDAEAILIGSTEKPHPKVKLREMKVALLRAARKGIR